MYNAELGQQADLLQSILHVRLKNHFVTKLGRRSLAHYSLIWATSQLGRVSCIHVLLGQCKSSFDLNLLSATNECLLRTPPRWKPLTTARSALVGVYACIDLRRGCFIRSGKTISVNMNFGLRKGQHQRGSSNPSSRSNRRSLFYNSYPESLETPRGREVPIRGLFSNIKWVIAFVWDYDQTDGISSLFDWPVNVLTKMSRSKNVVWRESESARNKKESESDDNIFIGIVYGIMYEQQSSD